MGILSKGTVSAYFWAIEPFPRTCKPVNDTLSTSAMDHMFIWDHEVVHVDFKFLGNESNRYLLELKESWLIKRDKPALNKYL